MGIAQHHDAVSGTEKQHVANDYAQRLSQGIDSATVARYEGQNRLKIVSFRMLLTKHIRNYFPNKIRHYLFQLNFFVHFPISVNVCQLKEQIG